MRRLVRLTAGWTAAWWLCAASGASMPLLADEPPKFELRVKDHRFTPSEIHLSAGKPYVLVLYNDDDTAEEFDSTALHVEKVVVGGRWALIRLHPLSPGHYPFMGEFHPDTARGTVIAE